MAASSSSDDEKDSPKRSSSNKTDAKSPPPPRTTSNSSSAPYGPAYTEPQMMYYPAPMGYSQPAHPGGQPYNNGYPPSQAYAAYPYYGGGGPPPPYRSKPGAGTAFLRGFILCSCFIFTGFFLISLVVALVLHPRLPVYHVVSLSVSNFNTTPSLSANWDTKFRVENPNDRLKGHFSDLKVDVVFQYGELAVNAAQGFELDKQEQKEMGVKLTSDSANGMALEKSTMHDLVKERATGSVHFGLRISAATKFRSGSMTTRTAATMAICDDLRVVFQNHTGNGNLDNGGKPVPCILAL